MIVGPTLVPLLALGLGSLLFSIVVAVAVSLRCIAILIPIVFTTFKILLNGHLLPPVIVALPFLAASLVPVVPIVLIVAILLFSGLYLARGWFLFLLFSLEIAAQMVLLLLTQLDGCLLLTNRLVAFAFVSLLAVSLVVSTFAPVIVAVVVRLGIVFRLIA